MSGSGLMPGGKDNGRRHAGGLHRARLIVYASEAAAEREADDAILEAGWTETITSPGEITDDLDLWLDLPDGQVLRLQLWQKDPPLVAIPAQPRLSLE